MKIQPTEELMRLLVAHFIICAKTIFTTKMPPGFDDDDCSVAFDLKLRHRKYKAFKKFKKYDVGIGRTNGFPFYTYPEDEKAFAKNIKLFSTIEIEIPEWILFTDMFKGQLRIQCFRIEFLPKGSSEPIVLGEIKDGLHECVHLKEGWTESALYHHDSFLEDPLIGKEILYGAAS